MKEKSQFMTNLHWLDGPVSVLQKKYNSYQIKDFRICLNKHLKNTQGGCRSTV